jgi:hypothetical protein
VISKFFGVVMSGRKKIADFDPLSSSKTMNAKEPGENDLEFTYIIPLLHFHEKKGFNAHDVCISIKYKTVGASTIPS